MVLASGSYGLVGEAKRDRYPPAFRVRTAQDSSLGTRDRFRRWQHLLKVESELELVRQRNLGPGGPRKSGALGARSQQCRERSEERQRRFQGRRTHGQRVMLWCGESQESFTVCVCVCVCVCVFVRLAFS